jgi:hypothetical protein
MSQKRKKKTLQSSFYLWWMRSALIELRNSAEACCSPFLFYRPNRERYTTIDYLLFLLGLCDQIAKNLNGLSQQTLCPRSGALTFCIIRIESNNKELQQSCRQWIDCARGVVTACGNSLFIRQKIGMQLCTYNLMNARHRSTAAAAAAGAHCAI